MATHKKKCVCGHLLDVEEVYQQGAKEFAEWLKKSHWRIDLSEALKEWQEGAENE